MEILNAHDTAALLPYPELADALLAVLDDVRSGIASAPPRLAVPLAEDGTLLLMPATDGALAITKLVTVHPGNGARGMPSVQGEVVVLDARTGERLFTLEGATVTARRTAALSLLAARLLAPHPQGGLLIVGGGTQGRAHLEAFQAGLGIRDVWIYSRTAAHAERLAAYARELGLTAQTIAEPAEVLDRVSLIVTATTSSSPVLPASVQDNAFVAAVGAFRPTMAELPAELVRRGHVYVDSLEGARSEAGDLIQADVDWGQVTALVDAAQAPRPARGPIVFKAGSCAMGSGGSPPRVSEPSAIARFLDSPIIERSSIVDKTFRHLGDFSDWVADAARLRALFPDAVPGPETQARVRDVLGWSHLDEAPQDVRIESTWERDGIIGEAVSWSVGYGPRTQAWVLEPAGTVTALPGIVGSTTMAASNTMGRKIADGPNAPEFVDSRTTARGRMVAARLPTHSRMKDSSY